MRPRTLKAYSEAYSGRLSSPLLTRSWRTSAILIRRYRGDEALPEVTAMREAFITEIRSSPHRHGGAGRCY